MSSGTGSDARFDDINIDDDGSIEGICWDKR
jgi:hypothetical protein